MPPGNPQSDSQWVYRQAELVLGPISAQAVEEMLFAGTLTSQSEVAPVGSRSFRPVADVERFRVVAAKAQTKLRLEAVARAERTALRRRRVLQLGAVGVVALIAAAVAAIAARYMAVHAPLSGVAGEAEISVEPPVIRLAQAGAGEELLEYGQAPSPTRPGVAPGTSSGPSTGAGAPGGRPLASARPNAPERPRRSGGGKLGAADSDGMQTGAFDQAAINAVVASHQRTLFPCLQAAAQRNPELQARVPIEFVIGNDGRVTKVWVDHAELKRSELPACLLRELQKWPFPRMEGEQPSVSLAFTIGRKS